MITRRNFIGTGIICSLPLFKYIPTLQVSPVVTSPLRVPSTTIPSGNFISSNFMMPVGISIITTQFIINPTDLANPTKSFTFGLWRETTPSSDVFILDHGFSWTGGMTDPKTGLLPQPSMIVEVGPLAGVKCQMRIILSQSLTSAIEVTTV